MVGAAPLREQLLAELPAMLEATTRLAAIDSGSHDPAGVDRVADGFAELFTVHGFVISRSPLSERGHQLTARLELGDGPTLLVLGHADTVWPAGTAAAWPPVRDDTFLHGPGVGDMKGCVVMAAHAVGAALRNGLDGIGAIEVLIVPDEELGSPDSRAWVEGRARAAGACLGLEAGWPGGGVVVARGAVGALYLTARGRAAHCAAHEDEGASALAALAALVEPLEACGRPPDGVRVSVGVFRGGTARQVVPDEAELHVDLRAPDAASAQALLERIRSVAATASHPEVTIELRGGFTRPAFTAEVADPLWRLASERARELGVPLAAVRARGGSDASFAGALSVPTLDGLGPICHDSCSRRERIEIASLADRGALLAGLIVDVADRWRGGIANDHW
jgi:glutamate carboxypeptidase